MASFLSSVLPNIVSYYISSNTKKNEEGKTHTEYKEYTKYKKYGWKKDLPDKRDLHFQYCNSEIESAKALSKYMDLRSKCPKVYNQGKLGSCTANAIACAIQYDEIIQNNKLYQVNKDNKENKENNESNNEITKQAIKEENRDNEDKKEETQSDIDVPSRLFIYYNEREMEGNVDNDTGASLRDGIKSINKVGYCNETQWPYEIDRFREKPEKSCYEYASHHKALSYKRVLQDETHIKSVINMGFPIVFGISVYESFETEETTKTGMVPMPKEGERMLGGHAIVLVGYDDSNKRFIFRNSWGEEWGDKGYGYLPYKYVCDKDLASDFWVVSKVC